MKNKKIKDIIDIFNKLQKKHEIFKYSDRLKEINKLCFNKFEFIEEQGLVFKNITNLKKEKLNILMAHIDMVNYLEKLIDKKIIKEINSELEKDEIKIHSDNLLVVSILIYNFKLIANKENIILFFSDNEENAARNNGVFGSSIFFKNNIKIIKEYDLVEIFNFDVNFCVEKNCTLEYMNKKFTEKYFFENILKEKNIEKNFRKDGILKIKDDLYSTKEIVKELKDKIVSYSVCLSVEDNFYERPIGVVKKEKILFFNKIIQKILKDINLKG